MLDIVHEGFDLAVRVGDGAGVSPGRAAAGAARLRPLRLPALPGPPGRAGVTPEQLREHSLVMFSGGSQRRGWSAGAARTVASATSVKVDGPARLRMNNALAVRDALLHSLGIGQLPLLVAAESVGAGRLVPVLPAWRPPLGAGACGVPEQPLPERQGCAASSIWRWSASRPTTRRLPPSPRAPAPRGRGAAPVPRRGPAARG